jgi:hypothetical protein
MEVVLSPFEILERPLAVYVGQMDVVSAWMNSILKGSRR